MFYKHLALAVFLTVNITSLFAQVTIGSSEKPEKGALLQLKDDGNYLNGETAKKGLALPRVEITTLTPATNQIAESIGGVSGSFPWNKDTHTGLIVYNVKTIETATNRICPGIHIWSGNAWKPLVPYLEPSETTKLTSIELKNFTFLDPSDTTNPIWTTLGKDPSLYPLGYVGTFTDNRDQANPETYNYTRFYVTYTISDYIYTVSNNYTCDQDPAKITTTTRTEPNILKFEDGLWMTDNLRAITLPDGTPIVFHTSESISVPQYSYPDKQSTNRASLGVLYNWPAAMGKDPSDNPVGEGGTIESPSIQGICPDGWFLPSDRQFTDLENAIRINTNLFSTTPDSTIPNIDYGTTAPDPIGTAMKSTISVNGGGLNGTSNSVADGGFNISMAGYVLNDVVKNYALAAHLWSSSANGINDAWGTYFLRWQGDVPRNTFGRGILFSVRCKKN